jgi:amidohydrolase
VTTPYDRARQAIAEANDTLLSVNRFVHAHPELNFCEVESSRAVADALEGAGFTVERGTYELATSFRATYGSGSLVVGICAEYDALPEVGHACGHNIIASAAVGAALGLSAVAHDLDLTVVVLGTPAEEGGGGKVMMLERGAFADLHLAMMIHPWASERLEATCLAVSHFDVTFTGKAAHASGAPWKGRNAADAMVIAQVAIGLLRQELPPGEQVHGIVTSGGEAPNVIPELVTGRFMCRTHRRDDLDELVRRVRQCFEAGALATDTSFELSFKMPNYSHMESDVRLLSAYRSHAEACGRNFDDDDAGLAKPTLSTDMANVSLALPSIHPLVKVEAAGASNHQHEFAAACITPSADQAMIDGALTMALTAIDVALDPKWRADLEVLRQDRLSAKELR